MRFVVSIVAACGLAAVAGAAYAQNQSRAHSAQNFVRHCVASPYMSSYREPEPACACAAGIYSARMDDRQFTILGRVSHLAGNQAGMRAEVQALMREGYRMDEIQSVADILGDPEQLVERTCEVLQR